LIAKLIVKGSVNLKKITLLFIILIFFLSIAPSLFSAYNDEFRAPTVAGKFYPKESNRLKEVINHLLSEANTKAFNGQIVSLFVPHAGYNFSGQTASLAYKTIQGKKFDLVIIIGCSQDIRFKGAALLGKNGYKTPLGKVFIDKLIYDKLKKEKELFYVIDKVYKKDFTIEMQIPFLQFVLKGFKIVPILIGDRRIKICKNVADKLFASIKDDKRNILIIFTSNLASDLPYDVVKKLDKNAIKRIKNYDINGFYDDINKNKVEASCPGAIVTGMLLAKKIGANKVFLLKYITSGDVVKSKNKHVVGYASFVFIKNDPGEKMKKKAGIDLGLSDKDKKMLLAIARKAIESELKGAKPPSFEVDSPILKENRGAFVTIHENGELRGCIGLIRGYKPLYKTVEEMAVAAAFRDPRFPPLRRDELNKIDIEISALTPLRKITDINEIEVGKHGIYIEKGLHSGLLLPQVATEYGWDRLTFLEQTCWKAGLPLNAWKSPDASIYIFSADIFSEKDFQQ